MLAKQSSKWKDLVTGKLQLKTDNVGLQMFLKRSTTRFSTPRPPEELEQRVDELYNFFVKYEHLLGKELATISK
jgi:hypothetical protein